ncbi:ankyrin repeat [Cedratvirus lausannensis]|uniref:Ankyrin repeat n=1 Tax=Cedratvirus lausannensis TaxID=2023205 RepID=A0A285Q1F0_9VIRU|nr:ankyrin repeat [Cedratvirus lausannensis]
MAREIAEIAIEHSLFFLLGVCREFISDHLCIIAAKNNNLPLLQWAKSKGYKHDEWIYYHPMVNNNLEMVKWLRDNDGTPQLGIACSSAATCGRLEILKWCKEENFPWNSATCTNAARYGHLKILKWARANGWFYRLAIKFYIRLRLI